MEKEKELVQVAVEMALSLGIVMGKESGVGHAPFALKPSAFPRSCFDRAQKVAPYFNLLVDKISRDTKFLIETHKEVIETDLFTGKLLELLQVKSRQTLSLGLHRMDYMLHEEGGAEAKLQQVEINTISAAFSSMGQKMSDLHRYLAETRPDCFADEYRAAGALPRNSAGKNHAAAIAKAHCTYITRRGHADGEACAASSSSSMDASSSSLPSADAFVVLFVVLPEESNVFDQRSLEWELWKSHGVRSIRRSFAQIAAEGTHCGSEKALHIGHQEVTVAYFRSGYSPDHYGPTAWTARQFIEESFAIKCPTIGYQLAGTKKVQQCCAKRQVLEKFFPGKENEEVISLMMECFAGLYSLGISEETEEVVKKAIENPQGYVLKPQREGGGNNLYAEQLRDKISTLTAKQRCAYILMSRISPRPFSSIFLRCRLPFSVQASSEFGVFSCFLGDGVEEALLNKPTGHLLRSKAAAQDDGGVAAGVAVLDSPFLT